MKKIILGLGLLISSMQMSEAQVLRTNNPMVDQAFQLAVTTLDKNTKDSLIKAGGFYGGEWTRDIAINTWNGAGLIRPAVSRFSLWSVTQNNRSLIGHQYWDKIIWVAGAWNYYLMNGDQAFLKQAYVASKNTMHELETTVYDVNYGLFTGPSVFNDGIAGYEEPVYEDPGTESGVLAYPAHEKIKCLSTNCIYYEAYRSLSAMARQVGDGAAIAQYDQKAS